MTSYGFRVYGIPKPQGSKIPGVSSKGKPYVREQAGQKLKDWRSSVKEAALLARGADENNEGVAPIDTITQACAVQIQFLVPRPASVPESKRKYPSVMPDLDKMVRATLDALKEAGVYKDDSLVIKIWAIKQYAGDNLDASPGAWITVTDQLS